MDFLAKFDGTNRKPRECQVTALKWLQDNWSSKVLALNLPTGTGKSAIARAIQIATDADVVPPTNQLMDQYTDLYSDVNALKGKVHYKCSATKLNCSDAYELTKPESPNKEGEPCYGYCKGCPYNERRQLANFVPTFFNPSSLFFFNMTTLTKDREVLVIDEAHKIKDVMMGMSGRTFNSRKFDVPKSVADISIEEWLDSAEIKLRVEAKGMEKNGEYKKAAELHKEATTVNWMQKSFIENPENFAIDITRNPNGSRSLTIQPISPPRYIADRFLLADKVVLLSATLLPSDVREILGHDDFKFLDLPSPIPKEHRQIKYVPSPHPMNTKTPPELIAASIKNILAKHPNENTIIHVTYGMAEKLAEFLPKNILRNTSENKDEVINNFKRNGGIFMASGCSEGIDLPGDCARINIIPILFRLNPTDTVVKKKLGKPNGRAWYNYETIKTLIQQAGRTTRGEEDYSVTYVLDPALPKLLTDKNLTIPKSLSEAIKWSAN